MGLFIDEFPHLLIEVDREKTLALGTDINTIKSSDTTRVSWICKDCSHKWPTAICNRTKRNKPTGCPACAGNIFTEKNSLKLNHPEIFSEINIAKTVRKGIDPHTLTKSNPKKVWWNCGNGHDPWEARVSDRTRKRKPSGCPNCKNSMSKQEVRIYTELKHFYPDTISHYKMKNKEIDVFIPSLNTGVEFDGEHWHEDKIEQDKAKTEKLQKLGIRIIRVRERNLPRIFSNDIFVNRGKLTSKDMKSILLQIDGSKFMSYNNFVANRIYQDILNNLPLPIYEKSLAHTHSELIKEWDYESNSERTPEMFTYGSIEKINWVCEKEHKWVATINSRTSNMTGCKECYLQRSGTLAEVKPYALEWWDYSKNSDSPTDISSNTKYKRYYSCPECRKSIYTTGRCIHEDWSCISCSSKKIHRRKIKHSEFPHGLVIDPSQVKTDQQKRIATTSQSMPFYIYFDHEIAKEAGVEKSRVSKLKQKFTKLALEKI